MDKKVIKKMSAIILMIVMAVSMTACKSKSKDAFYINVVCESKGIYQIFYTCYFDDERYGAGGLADLDGKEITADTKLEAPFAKTYLENREDLSGFLIDFSPYGKDDKAEIGTTNTVSFNPEYGKTYTILFSGDKESGFKAELQEEK